MPELERLWRRYQGNGVVVIGISTDVDPGLVSSLVARQRYTFPIGLDPRGEIAKQFGARVLPTTSIINAEGRLAAFAYGPRRWDTTPAIDLLEALRAGQER
jgi:peroxiredoxin